MKEDKGSVIFFHNILYIQVTNKKKKEQFVGSREAGFFAMAPALQNIFPSDIRSAPSLLMYWKSLKIWLCHEAWGPREPESYLDGATIENVCTHFLYGVCIYIFISN